MARLLPLVLGLALGGCGPQAAVWLRVEAPLRVPDHCDEVRVAARWDEPAGPLAFEKTWRLDGVEQFPLTLTLTADEAGEPGRIFVEVTGLKEGEVAPPGAGWAEGTGEAALERGKITPLTVKLSRP